LEETLMHVDGSCHCGAVRFEAEIEATRVGICHCTDCQTFASSAFRTSVFVSDRNFRMLEGKPALYEKVAESGAGRSLAFCARCGTHVYGMTQGDEATFYSVRVGTLAQRAELSPVAQVWCRSELPWLADLSEIRKISTQ
jgi:hypothetical protein